ncbi:MAG: PQQ-binding-like beta-propeller repeat protein [Hyphomicrobiaceae bacterium]
MSRSARHAIAVLAVLAAGSLTAGCSGSGLSMPSMPKIGDLNPFAKPEEKLPGTRIAIITEEDTESGEETTASLGAVVVPGMVSNAEWSQPGGTASNSPGHLSLEGGLKTVWTGDAGHGSNSHGKLTATPIVHRGRIYTLDTGAQISAFSAAGGGRAWAVSLVPEGEDAEEGYGGGLAAEDGRLFAATGYGQLVALDASGGAKLWEKALGAPARTSPTVSDGRVFITTIEGKLYCLSAQDGAELWSFRGVPQSTGIINNVSPAVSGDTVIVPYSSGDVIAVKASTGEAIWTDSLGITRSHSSFARLNDTGRPVADNGTVFVVGHAGRMIATSERTGERLWSINLGGLQTPWVAGDSVFVTDVNGRLVALERDSGSKRWAVKLPGDSRWNGPVLAGGRLWLVSEAGEIVGVDPQSGKVVASRSLGEKVEIAPIVAENRMFVLTDSARLVALN